jgi:hypothetical protein
MQANYTVTMKSSGEGYTDYFFSKIRIQLKEKQRHHVITIPIQEFKKSSSSVLIVFIKSIDRLIFCWEFVICTIHSS